LERRSRLRAGDAILVDCFIVSARLALVRTSPATRRSFFLRARSAERAHRPRARSAAARPLLDLGLRLGEASGALLALPLLDHACALHGPDGDLRLAGVPECLP